VDRNETHSVKNKGQDVTMGKILQQQQQDDFA
jgi:uncharacterized protein YnzC (UPF0291/DUF896 family)